MIFFSLTGLRVWSASNCISKLPNLIFFLKAGIVEKPSFNIRNNSGSNITVIADYVCDLGQTVEFFQAFNLTKLLLGLSKIIVWHPAQYLSTYSGKSRHCIPSSPLLLLPQGPLCWEAFLEALPHSQAGLRRASLLCPHSSQNLTSGRPMLCWK